MEPGPAPTFVEIFGSPGAGKTTLSRALQRSASVLTRGELSVTWRTLSAARKGAIAAAALRRPDCAMRAGEAVFKASLFRRDSLAGLGRLVVKSHWLPNVVRGKLVEEGPLQDLWSIFYSSGRFEFDPSVLSPLIASLYRDTRACIAFIELDARTASKRIAERHSGKSRFDGASETIIVGKLERAAHLPANIAAAARQAGLQVVTLDGSVAIPVLAEQLRLVWASATGSAGGTDPRTTGQARGCAV
jgi:hypothetical protein